MKRPDSLKILLDKLAEERRVAWSSVDPRTGNSSLSDADEEDLAETEGLLEAFKLNLGERAAAHPSRRLLAPSP